MVRLWMDDPENDGWGEPSTENPYFNTSPRHSYNVGSDFNHSSGWTKLYTKRVIKHWIEEYKIDSQIAEKIIIEHEEKYKIRPFSKEKPEWMKDS